MDIKIARTLLSVAYGRVGRKKREDTRTQPSRESHQRAQGKKEEKRRKKKSGKRKKDGVIKCLTLGPYGFLLDVFLCERERKRNGDGAKK